MKVLALLIFIPMLLVGFGLIACIPILFLAWLHDKFFVSEDNTDE